jgi:nucleotide-binding universal stress UspA family protein
VAAFAVFFAPRLQARFGTVRVLYGNLVGCAIVMVAIAVGVHTPAVVIVAVILSGAFIGNNNTLTTQAVMLVAPVEKPIASSAYGFVRFIGGGLAPFVAGKIADATSLSIPFYVGGLAFLLAIPVLASGRRLIDAAEDGEAQGEPVLPPLERVGAPATGRPVVVAVGPRTATENIVDAAARMAADATSPLDVVHVQEIAVVSESVIESEELEEARAAVREHLERLAAQGVPATGHVLPVVGDHATAGRVLAHHADAVDARAVAIGHSTRGAAAQFADGSFTAALIHAAPCSVVLVDSPTATRELTSDALAGLRQGA